MLRKSFKQRKKVIFALLFLFAALFLNCVYAYEAFFYPPETEKELWVVIKIKKRSDIIVPLSIIKCSGKIFWGPYEGIFEKEILIGAKGSLTVVLERKYSGPFTIVAEIDQDTHLIESIKLKKSKKISPLDIFKIVYPTWKKVEEKSPFTPYPDYPQYPSPYSDYNPDYPQYPQYPTKINRGG